MNIKNVLFPTDFSECNEAALQYATRLAVESGAKLHFLHVHDIRGLGTAMGEASYVYSDQWENERRQAEENLNDLVPPDPLVPFERHWSLGVPEAEIVGFAKDNHIDLIVMASHGRTGLRRLIMGSVAEAVMRRATCPVLVVKQPEAQATADRAIDAVNNKNPQAADANA